MNVKNMLCLCPYFDCDWLSAFRIIIKLTLLERRWKGYIIYPENTADKAASHFSSSPVKQMNRSESQTQEHISDRGWSIFKIKD